MFELLNGGKKGRVSDTPEEVVHLRFNESPFIEENLRSTITRSVSLVDGAWDKGLRPVANNGWLRTVIEPRNYSQAFTYEFMARRAPGVTIPTNQYCGVLYDPAGAVGIGIQYYAGQFYIYDTSGTAKWVGGNGMLTADSIWRHHALVFSNGTYRFFRAGALLATFAGVSALPSTRDIHLYVGGHPSLSISGLAIDFDECLVTPGVAKYSAAFTPPDKPFFT